MKCREARKRWILSAKDGSFRQKLDLRECCGTSRRRQLCLTFSMREQSTLVYMYDDHPLKSRLQIAFRQKMDLFRKRWIFSAKDESFRQKLDGSFPRPCTSKRLEAIFLFSFFSCDTRLLVATCNYFFTQVQFERLFAVTV